MDVYLVNKVLERSGMLFDLVIATDKPEFLEAIGEHSFDAIIADHSLPQFTSIDALHILKDRGINVPFILVTGTVSEEFSVTAMKEGASDYILKDRLQRLPSAVVSAIERYRLETEREQYFNELVAKQALMNEAERLSHMGSWHMDYTTGHTYWSDEKYRILGYEPGEVTPSLDIFMASIHPGEQQYIKRIHEDAFAGKDRLEYDSILLTRKNKIKHIHSELVIRRDPEGHITSLNGFIIDISPYKQAQLKLTESEQKYRNLFENNPMPIWIIDARTQQFLDANNAALKLYGYSRGEFLKINAADIRPVNDEEQLQAASDTASAPFTDKGACTHLKKDGSKIQVEIKVDSLLFEGRDACMVMINDITEKIRNKEMLQKTEANLHTIFNNTDTGYVLLDKALRVLSFNEPIEAFSRAHLGRGVEYGSFAPEYFSADRQPVIINSLQKALAGDASNYEVAYELRDGSAQWYLCSYHPVWDPYKNILGVIMSITEITSRKLLELQEKKIAADLLQRNKDLEQFAYIISHNLRAPVANIIGISALITEQDLSVEEKNLFVDGLATSAQKLDEVIVDLNNILRVKSSVDEHKEEVSFSQVLTDIQFSIKDAIEKEKVAIASDFSACDHMSTFKSYIHSIFYNLISNSIKYRRRDTPPVIEIRSQADGNRLLLHFKDNAAGIDLHRKGSQVFGLYKRFHTDMAEGKGIGLYMVKTQVEALGGKISISSEVNSGTEFCIEFDLPKNPK